MVRPSMGVPRSWKERVSEESLSVAERVPPMEMSSSVADSVPVKVATGASLVPLTVMTKELVALAPLLSATE